MWAALRVSSWVKKRTDDVSNHKFKIGRAIPPSQQNRHMIKREGGFEPIFRQVPNNAPALLIRTSIGGSRVAISAAARFISAKRVRSAKYTEWAAPGPLLPSRAKVASARDLLRAIKTMRAPIGRVLPATSSI